MKTLLLVAVAIGVSACSSPPLLLKDSSRPPRHEILASVQSLSVGRLDPRLSDEPLSTWLAAVLPPGTPVGWSVNDCGAQNGTDAIDPAELPTCVEATARLADQRVLSIAVPIGFHGRQLTANQLHWMSISSGYALLADSIHLSDLPTLLQRTRTALPP